MAQFACFIRGSVVFSTLLFSSTLVHGADPVTKTKSALDIAPRDAAFFWSVAHTRKSVERFLSSKAYQRWQELMGAARELAGLEATGPSGITEALEVEESLTQVWSWFDREENRPLRDLLLEMVSHEIFIYGSGEYSEISRELVDFQAKVNQALRREIEEGGDLDVLESADALDLSRLEEAIKKLSLPDTVVGFKIQDTERAESQLMRLKAELPKLLADHPDWLERIRLEKIGRGQFLTITANGSDIPWDELTADGDEENLEKGKRIRDIVTKKSLTVSLGILDGYVLFSFGDTNEHLERFGEGESLLDRPELDRLRQHSGRELISVAYISDDLAKSSYSTQGYFDQIAIYGRAFMQGLELDEMMQGQIGRDLDELAADLKTLSPKPGGFLGFTFFTDRGFEGYQQNWSENLYSDGGEPLALLDHLGGDPLFFAAGRSKYRPQDYAMLVKWLKRADGYVQEFALQQLDEDGIKQAEALRAATTPVLEQIDQAISQMLLPAFRDGQSAFVLDAKLKSEQWHVAQPPSAKPLPMLELALVYGVSDAELLKQGIGQIVDVVNKIAASMHEANPEEIAAFQVPSPAHDETDSAEFFHYPYLEALGVDRKIVPTAGLSKHVLALALSREHTERLLGKQPLQTETDGILAQYAGKPLASAARFNCAGLIDAVMPWVEYGIDQLPTDVPIEALDDVEGDAAEPGAEEGEAKQVDPVLQPEDLKRQFARMMEMIKCFRGSSSVTFVEGKSLVTHYEWHFEDLTE